jgi:hypothetical protein
MPNVPEALLAEVAAGWLDSFARDVRDDESGAAELNAHLAACCARQGVETPRTLTPAELARIRALRADLARRWHALSPGEAMELRFPADG